MRLRPKRLKQFRRQWYTNKLNGSVYEPPKNLLPRKQAVIQLFLFFICYLALPLPTLGYYQ